MASLTIEYPEFGSSLETSTRILPLEIAEDDLLEMREFYFPGHRDEYLKADDPEGWPYYRIRAATELEAASIRAIAPQRVHLDIFLMNEVGRVAVA